MEAITEMAPRLGVAPTCAALELPRATYYRNRVPRPAPKPPPTPARALVSEEREQVLAVLHEPRFVDLAPAEVYATLLDEDRYLCSERTFYRVLQANAEVRERRDHLRHPHYAAPELLATRPNELWSWDITKLLGPTKWTYYYLYVVLDVFSRYVVGWMLAYRESAALAEKLIAQSCERQAWPSFSKLTKRVSQSRLTGSAIYYSLGGYRIAVTNIGRIGAVRCRSWNICFWSASSPREPTCCPG